MSSFTLVYDDGRDAYVDIDTGEVFPNGPADQGVAKRVAARYLKRSGYFNVGDYIWMGKYKNKLGQIIAFGVDEKGNPTVTIRPVPQGRKQDKTFSLFKIWKVKPEQLADMKAKGKLASD